MNTDYNSWYFLIKFVETKEIDHWFHEGDCPEGEISLSNTQICVFSNKSPSMYVSIIIFFHLDKKIFIFLQW